MFTRAYSTLKDIKDFLTNSNSYIEGEISMNSVVKDLRSRYPNKIRQGMKKVLCLLQKKHDTAEFKNEILKLLDTRDVPTKRMINYYLLHFYKENKDVCERERLCEMYTNTLLKDLNDINEEIKNSAIEFLIFLKNIEFFPSFARKLKKILENGTIENQILILILIKEYSIINTNFIEKNELSGNIFSLFKENVLQLQIYALECLNATPPLLIQLQKEEIINFYSKISNLKMFELFYQGLTNIKQAIILNRKIFDTKDVSKILYISIELIKHDYISALIVSDIILSFNISLAQEILSNLENYLFLKNEDLFHLLRYLYKLITKYKLEFNVRKYIIYENDTFYNKKMKFMILNLSVNEFTINEILRLKNDTNFIMKVFKFCLENDIKNEDILNRAIRKSKKEAMNLIYLYKQNLLTKNEDSLIITYDSKITKNKNNLIKILLNEFRKGKLTKKDLVSQFKEISASDIFLEIKLKSLLKYIEEENYEVINELLDTREIGYKEKYIFEEETKDLQIQDFKPFVESETKVYLEEEFVFHPTNKEDNDLRKKYNKVEEELSEKLQIQPQKEKILKAITNIYFNCKVVLLGKLIKLKIENVTQPFVIDCAEFNKANVSINSPIEVELGIINGLKEFNLKVNNTYGYTVNINYNHLIEPFKCGIYLFTDMFNKLSSYEMISRDIIKHKIHIIDRKSFAFTLLEEVFFGKIEGKEIVLKCSNDLLLKEFSKFIRKDN